MSNERNRDIPLRMTANSYVFDLTIDTNNDLVPTRIDRLEIKQKRGT